MLKVDDVKVIVEAIDRMVVNQEKAKLKQVYSVFIEKITFEKGDNEHLNINLAFDETTKEWIEKREAPTDDESVGAIYLPNVRFNLGI